MNKEQFNKLEIQQQVEYINNQLVDNSLTKVCEAIGIDRATVRKRFKTKGYTLVDNKYINEPMETAVEPKTEAVKTVTKSKSSQQKTPKSNDIKELEVKVNKLEAQIKDIMEIIGNKELLETTDNTKNNIDVYTGETVTRSYKINKEVYDEFQIFCKRNNNYRITDIISSALEQFINGSNE